MRWDDGGRPTSRRCEKIFPATSEVDNDSRASSGIISSMKASVMPPKCNLFIAPGNNPDIQDNIVDAFTLATRMYFVILDGESKR